MVELAVAKKILNEPFANIQLGTISGIVRQITNHTSIESIDAKRTRIGYVISSWENALLNGDEKSIILERGYKATGRTRVLIIYKLISETYYLVLKNMMTVKIKLINPQNVF